jgi:hypothetical protein
LSEQRYRNDRRIESREPNLDSIKILGNPLSTKDNWKERRKIIDKMPHYTLNELKKLYEEKRVSLGIVRPTRVLDIETKEVTLEWKPKWQNLFEQLRLFGPQQKPLQKIPFSFHYIFECSDSSKPHKAMIEDWELGVLFLKERDRLITEKFAVESVKNKFLNEICQKDKDTRFFMGTRFPYNTWLVSGVFWPPRTLQRSLF